MRVVKFLRTAQMTLRTAQMTMRTAQMTMQELYGNRNFTAKELYSPEIFDTSLEDMIKIRTKSTIYGGISPNIMSF